MRYNRTTTAASFDDGQIFEIWSAMVERLLVEGYRRLFAEAYPATELEPNYIAHVANALAAFQTRALRQPTHHGIITFAATKPLLRPLRSSASSSSSTPLNVVAVIQALTSTISFIIQQYR